MSSEKLSLCRNHLCFCNFCKGNVQLTRHRIRQHVKIYGLLDARKSSEGPSTLKKSRVSSSSESDNEQDSCLANEDCRFKDVCEDCPADNDSDSIGPVSSVYSHNVAKDEVLNPLYDPWYL